MTTSTNTTSVTLGHAHKQQKMENTKNKINKFLL